MKMTPTDLPGVGDAAFFTSPGFNMVQLHAFKSAKYLLFTLLVPGLKEAGRGPWPQKLMKTVLPDQIDSEPIRHLLGANGGR